MTVRTKVIGRLPQNKREWDPNYVNPSTRQQGYGLKFRVFQYGCELESKIENNTYEPFSWDGDQTFVLDVSHWELCSGNPNVWAAGNPKPATTGTTGDYPYNGMGRVVIPKNMVNIAEQGDPENIVNLLTQDAFEDGEGNPLENTVFVIQYDFTLGEDITVPANCVLEFDGGSLSNGTAIGDNTKIVFNNKFLNGVKLTGTFYCDSELKDTDIFIDNNYNTSRITSLLCVSTPLMSITFAKNTYTNVESVTINRNVDIDFGGSIMNMKLEEQLLPSNFIFMEYKARTADNTIDFVKIKNVTIVGNPDSYKGHHVGTGANRRAIQIFNVNNVELNNVTLTNYNRGYTGEYGTNFVDRYELSIVSVFHYNNLLIDGFITHDSAADNIIAVVPRINPNNFAEIRNCHHYDCETGLFMITDGKCSVHDNVIEDYDSSALNVFCYDSEIYSNIFKNSSRSVAIDLTESGMYSANNVRIHDNQCYNSPFCDSFGSNILIENNSQKNDADYNVEAYGVYLLTGTGNQNSTNHPAPTILVCKNVKIKNNVFDNCWSCVKTMFAVTNYNTSWYNDVTIAHNKINNVKTTEYHAPIKINSSKNIFVKDNIIEGYAYMHSGSINCVFELGANNQPNSNNINGGDIKIEDNKVFCDIPGNNAIFVFGYYKDSKIYINRNNFVDNLSNDQPILWAKGNYYNIVECKDNINGKYLSDLTVDNENYYGNYYPVLTKGLNTFRQADNKPLWWDGNNWINAAGEQESYNVTLPEHVIARYPVKGLRAIKGATCLIVVYAESGYTFDASTLSVTVGGEALASDEYGYISYNSTISISGHNREGITGDVVVSMQVNPVS